MKRKKSFLIILCFALLLLFAFIFFFGRQGKIDNPLLPIDELAEKWKGNQDLPSGGENQEIVFLDSKPLYLEQINRAKKSISTIQKKMSAYLS